MPSTPDQHFLEHAIDLAIRHSSDGVHGPFGAVVVRDESVVGEGWNQVVAGRDPSAHAEINAIRNACRSLETHVLSGCTLYSSCEPCPMCLAAIYWARIDRLVFACGADDAAAAGFDDRRILREIRRDWSEREITWHQTGREAGLRVFERWRHNPDRVPY
jgi:guanine deaminase